METCSVLNWLLTWSGMCVRFHSRDMMSCSAFLATVAGAVDEPLLWARAVAVSAKMRTSDAAKHIEEFARDFAWFFITVTSTCRLRPETERSISPRSCRRKHNLAAERRK